MLHPGPLHAFYQRTRNRRGHGKAIVATARKLAILFWCMLEACYKRTVQDQQAGAPAKTLGASATLERA